MPVTIQQRIKAEDIFAVIRKYRHEFDFKICKLIDFLQELQASQAIDR